MGKLFASLFAMLSSIFTAGEKLGNTAGNLATWAEEASGTFADEARADREIAVMKSAKKRELLRAELNDTTTSASTTKTTA